jgi:hypothetical protein
MIICIGDSGRYSALNLCAAGKQNITPMRLLQHSITSAYAMQQQLDDLQNKGWNANT